jgi:hypothetical protein
MQAMIHRAGDGPTFMSTAAGPNHAPSDPASTTRENPR